MAVLKRIQHFPVDDVLALIRASKLSDDDCDETLRRIVQHSEKLFTPQVMPELAVPVTHPGPKSQAERELEACLVAAAKAGYRWGYMVRETVQRMEHRGSYVAPGQFDICRNRKRFGQPPTANK